VDACKTWRGAGYAESLFDENPPDEWDPQRKYALRVFRDTMHGASEEQVRERLQAAAVKKKRDVWRWFRDLPPEFLQKPSPAEEAPRPLTVGEYYGGQTTDPPKYGARADAGADDKQEKRVRVPENLDVLRLAKVINKARGSGRSKNEIAREFTEYDERKAQSLLRKLRDFPHLLD
jgi:hypothetical protein